MKLCDFGVSGELENSMALNRTFIGTRAYMAPERMTGEGYAVSSDIWSLGVTLIELVTGVFPIPADRPIVLVPQRSPPCEAPTTDAEPGPSIFALLAAIVDGPPPQLPTDAANGIFSPDFVDYIARCCQKDPSARPSLRELLALPWTVAAGEQTLDMRAWVASTIIE